MSGVRRSLAVISSLLRRSKNRFDSADNEPADASGPGTPQTQSQGFTRASPSNWQRRRISRWLPCAVNGMRSGMTVLATSDSGVNISGPMPEPPFTSTPV